MQLAGLSFSSHVRGKRSRILFDRIEIKPFLSGFTFTDKTQHVVRVISGQKILENVMLYLYRCTFSFLFSKRKHRTENSLRSLYLNA